MKMKNLCVEHAEEEGKRFINIYEKRFNIYAIKREEIKNAKSFEAYREKEMKEKKNWK